MYEGVFASPIMSWPLLSWPHASPAAEIPSVLRLLGSGQGTQVGCLRASNRSDFAYVLFIWVGAPAGLMQQAKAFLLVRMLLGGESCLKAGDEARKCQMR